MKISLCDVCNSLGVIKQAEYRSTVKRDKATKITLDTCEEHKNVFSGMNLEKALEYVTNNINTKCIVN